MTNIYDLDTPTLLVDLDRVEGNIARMAERVRKGGKDLRPHTKTHKTPELARMQLQAGAIGLTVAKVGEAEVMADAGFGDILIANEIVGAPKLARIMALLRRVRVIVGVDSLEVALPIAEAAKAVGVRAGVYIEMDTGLGRAGTRSLDETLQLARAIVELPSLDLVGIFTYEGGIYQAKDEQGRTALMDETANSLREAVAALAAQGTPVPVVSVGSTPGAPYMAQAAGITELRCGVYIFGDRMQTRYGFEPDSCATTVLATVVSVRPDGKVIVDAGTKALASDRPFPDQTFGEILGRPDLTLVGANEEHGLIQAQGPPNVRVGDKLRILPNHVCTCVNQHDTMTAFRGETVEAVWQIAGRGKIR